MNDQCAITDSDLHVQIEQLEAKVAALSSENSELRRKNYDIVSLAHSALTCSSSQRSRRRVSVEHADSPDQPDPQRKMQRLGAGREGGGASYEHDDAQAAAAPARENPAREYNGGRAGVSSQQAVPPD